MYFAFCVACCVRANTLALALSRFCSLRRFSPLAVVLILLAALAGMFAAGFYFARKTRQRRATEAKMRVSCFALPIAWLCDLVL